MLDAYVLPQWENTYKKIHARGTHQVWATRSSALGTNHDTLFAYEAPKTHRVNDDLGMESR